MDQYATRSLRDRIFAAWNDQLRGNRGADGRPDEHYALTIENVRGDGERFDLCLTFRAGRTYCCCENLCHTGVFTEKRWRQLRTALATHGVEPKRPIVMRIRTRLEAGARLHLGKPDQPWLEMHEAGPWTHVVRERFPTVLIAEHELR
jgi:hypothetical protein